MRTADLAKAVSVYSAPVNVFFASLALLAWKRGWNTWIIMINGLAATNLNQPDGGVKTNFEQLGSVHLNFTDEYIFDSI